MASIEKRGDYTYRITVSNGYDRNGKKITYKKTVTIDDSLSPKQKEKEVNRIAADFEAEVRLGNHVMTSLTFEKFVQQWLVDYGEKRLEKTTLNSYKTHLNTKILPAIGHVKLKELKPLHLIRFYENLTEDGARSDGKAGGYSTRIIKYQHSIISIILQTAVYWQILNENIAKRVQPPKGNDAKKGDNFLDENTTENFLSFVLNTEPILYQALVFVAAYGGLRKGEILGLHWSDISFVDNTIKINKVFVRTNQQEFIKEQPKNPHSNRTVAMPNIVMELLKGLQNVSTSEDRVFPISYTEPTRWFAKIKSKFNECDHHKDKIPSNMTFHGLRHTTATLLISKGLDIRTVAARLGHANATTTLQVYSHALKSQDRAAADALENTIKIKV